MNCDSTCRGARLSSYHCCDNSLYSFRSVADSRDGSKPSLVVALSINSRSLRMVESPGKREGAHRHGAQGHGQRLVTSKSKTGFLVSVNDGRSWVLDLQTSNRCFTWIPAIHAVCCLSGFGLHGLGRFRIARNRLGLHCVGFASDPETGPRRIDPRGPVDPTPTSCGLILSANRTRQHRRKSGRGFLVRNRLFPNRGQSHRIYRPNPNYAGLPRAIAPGGFA
jgi:hypothetical protein